MSTEGDEESGTIMWWGVLPAAWARHAEKLRRSAELLWKPLDHVLMLTSPLNESEVELWDHIYAFLFVAGAALETMLKAAAMQAEINKRRSFDAILTPRRELQGWVLKHKLVAFAERAGIPLSEDEKAQLERFTKYVVWAGRYPVPTHVRDPRKNAVVLYDFHVSNFDRVWFDRLYKSAHESYQHHASEFGAGTSDRGQKKH